MTYSPDKDFEGYKERGDDDEYEQDEMQWLDESEEPIKESTGKKKIFLIGGLVLLVLILASFGGYYFFGHLFKASPPPVDQETLIASEGRATTEEAEKTPPEEDIEEGARKEENMTDTDTTLTFEKETDSLYTYIERRPIPSNPFAPIPKPQPAAVEPEKPVSEQPSAGTEAGEAKEEKTAASFISRIRVKGIVGYEGKRLAILEEDGQSFIINEGNIIELFHSDGALQEQYRVDGITKTKVILFDVLKGLSKELVLGGES